MTHITHVTYWCYQREKEKRFAVHVIIRGRERELYAYAEKYFSSEHTIY